MPTDPPFTRKREQTERLVLALAALNGHGAAILAGSITGWGAELEDVFDLVVFVNLDAGIRRYCRLSRSESFRLMKSDSMKITVTNASRISVRLTSLAGTVCGRMSL